jgi:hypothetical protein
VRQPINPHSTSACGLTGVASCPEQRASIDTARSTRSGLQTYRIPFHKRNEKDLLNPALTDDMEAMGFLRASSSLAAPVRFRTPSSAVAGLPASAS